MKQYPTIPHTVVNENIYAFGKLDGSNVRAEWSKKRGFHKFGSRRQLIDASHSFLGEVPGLIQDKYGSTLPKIFAKQGWGRVIAFFEFWGPSSFAGYHDPSEEHTVTLLDVSVDKRGILEPKEFLKAFHDVDRAPMLYRGKPNGDFIQQVQNGTLPGMPFEGVVCKGKHRSPGLPLMFKVKSDAWYARLRAEKSPEEFERLK